MVKKVDVDVEKMVSIGVEEIRRGNIFILSEPHGDDIGVDVTKKIMSGSIGGSAKLLLEAPIQMHSESREALERFLSTTHTPRLSELPSHALRTGWGLHCVDGDFRQGMNVDIRQDQSVGRYSQERQSFIVGNIKRFVKLTHGGCVVLYGWNHVQGRSKGRMFPDGLTGFAEALTGVKYSGHTIYALRGTTNMYAMAIGRVQLV